MNELNYYYKFVIDFICNICSQIKSVFILQIKIKYKFPFFGRNNIIKCNKIIKRNSLVNNKLKMPSDVKIFSKMAYEITMRPVVAQWHKM